LGAVGCVPGKRRSAQASRDLPFEVPREALNSAEYGLTMARFRAQLGTTFTLVPPAGGSLDLKLIAVNNLGPAIKQPVARGEAFNCHFSPAGAATLPQDTYQMNHPVLGTFSIFIVPFTPPDQATGAALPPEYVASFNRV
jgi:hypothetical protein